MAVTPSREHGPSDLDPLSNASSAARKGGDHAESRRRIERGEEHAGPGAEHVSGQKQQVPAEAIEGVVKRIDLARPDFFGPDSS